MRNAVVMKAFFKKWFAPIKFKRLFDIVVSFLALVILSPLFLVICVINFFTPDTSVFFSHERRGRKGKPFKIYKFQTMKNNTPNCATGELENPEQYITKFGRFLRKTSLDELPQLWNILKGDMSFVGPRPLISSEIRAHRMRLEYGVYRFRPGLTGLAQIKGRDSISLMKKMKYDKLYCDNWSLKLDLMILLQSIGVCIRQEGFHEGIYHRR
ncbi:MAG: sugar transferase [Clostridiales bacterium]|nr:sugar transferase [Clostridiales bacterium]